MPACAFDKTCACDMSRSTHTYNQTMEDALLGGLSPKEFLRRHWQKRPLLVRRALPGFRGVIGKHALFALASRGEVESRLVERRGAQWRVTHGPLSRARFAKTRA